MSNEPLLEPRGCPTPGACSCPTEPMVPPDLIVALKKAEYSLRTINEIALIDGLTWAEKLSSQELPRIRLALKRWDQCAEALSLKQ